MTCCACQKNVNTKVHLVDGKVQWYGLFKGYKCIKLICRECYDDPKKKPAYYKG